MQIKTQWDITSSPHTFQEKKKKKKKQWKTSIGKDVEEREPTCTFGRAIIWCKHYVKQYGE